jgi:hypothetical protein
MSVTDEQARIAAHETLFQATGPTSNVRHLRSTTTKPYDDALDETRSVSLPVLSWSLVLAVLDKHDLAAVRELGETMRTRLKHPCAVDSDPTPAHGIERPARGRFSTTWDDLA